MRNDCKSRVGADLDANLGAGNAAVLVRIDRAERWIQINQVDRIALRSGLSLAASDKEGNGRKRCGLRCERSADRAPLTCPAISRIVRLAVGW